MTMSRRLQVDPLASSNGPLLLVPSLQLTTLRFLWLHLLSSITMIIAIRYDTQHAELTRSS